jgi:hypothetical protein
MGEYADMAVDAGIGECWYGGEDRIPSYAYMPSGSYKVIGEIIDARETDKAWCIRFVVRGELCPPVFVPKSKTKMSKDRKDIWMPRWLSNAKADEITKLKEQK